MPIHIWRERGSAQAITYHVPLNDDIDGLHEEHPGHIHNNDTDKNLLSVGLGRREDMLVLVLLLEWTHSHAGGCTKH